MIRIIMHVIQFLESSTTQTSAATLSKLVSVVKLINAKCKWTDQYVSLK